MQLATAKFGSNLARYRKKRGMTQEQLAQMLAVTPQAVSKWEKGSYPDGDLLPKLARILDVSLDVLFGLKTDAEEIHFEQAILHEIRKLPERERGKRVMELCYDMLSAYDQNITTESTSFPDPLTVETFAQLRTNYELALARLNPDMQYFCFLRIPEKGIDNYAEISPHVMDLFRLLSNEAVLRILFFVETLPRNFLLTKECIARRLNLPLEAVSQIIDQLDRLGIVWQLTADIGDDPFPIYGYVHSVPLIAILTLATSLTHFISCCAPEIDLWTEPPFKGFDGTKK